MLGFRRGLKMGLVGVGVLLATLLSSCLNYNIFMDRSPDVEKEFTVMAWNFLRGQDGNGLNEIIEIIGATGADVILVQESDYTDEAIVAATGLYVAKPTLNLAIYSVYPILDSRVYSAWNFVTAIIDVEGTPVQVATIHLDWLPECTEIMGSSEELMVAESRGKRIRQTRDVLRRLEVPMVNNIPLIVGGDFNSHSHLDWTEVTRDLPGYAHGGRVVPWGVSTLFANAGFKDSFREMHSNPAEYYGETWLDTYKNEGRVPCRIDYIYYRGDNIVATDSDVFIGELGGVFEFEGQVFTFPSDHGFVLTTFRINGL